MFFRLISWFFIIGGLSESFLCLSQLYGYSVSNHGLYGFTGSFYNPGPCMGFLAMCLPVCLHEWLERRKSVGGYIALGVLLLMLCVQSTAIREMWEEVRKQVNRK